jgi:alpha-tubulin suppressor-like RCC1 family protein
LGIGYRVYYKNGLKAYIGNDSDTYNKIDDNITDIFCGYHSTFYLRNKTLYATGYNCGREHTSLGLGGIQPKFTAEPISNNVVRFYASALDRLFITEDGNIYIFGKSSYIPHSFITRLTPMWLDASHFVDVPGQIQKVCFGIDHMLILAEYQLYGCGSNQMGQLGLGKDIQFITQIQLIIIDGIGIIDDIACGQNFSVLIGDGKAYATGLNKDPKLGVDTSDEYVYSFTPITSFIHNINPNLRFNSVVCSNHTIGLITNQFLYL